MTTAKVVREHPILFSAPMVRAILAGTKTMTRRVMKPEPPEDWQPDLVGRYCPTIETASGELRDGPKIFGACNEDWGIKCPYGAPGDRLWVRETWRCSGGGSNGLMVCYRADDQVPSASVRRSLRLDQLGRKVVKCTSDEQSARFEKWSTNWRPSIHMPRWACRINLEITGIRVERLQNISEADAQAEGVRAFVELTGDEVFDRTLCPRCGGTGLFTANSVNGGACFDTDCDICDTHKKRFQLLWDSINSERGFGWQVNPWVWVVEFRRAA